MDKKTFIDNFVITFISTWAATNYEDCCSLGQQERLDKPPIEDAFFLADRAWEEYLDKRPSPIYYCIEAPCGYQTPRVKLIINPNLDKNLYECPMCKRAYTEEFLQDNPYAQ